MKHSQHLVLMWLWISKILSEKCYISLALKCSKMDLVSRFITFFFALMGVFYKAFKFISYPLKFFNHFFFCYGNNS